MKPHTERLRAEYMDVVRRGRELVARLDDAALTRRPAAGGWSAAECLDHLSATAELYVRRLRHVLDEAAVRSDSPDEKHSLTGRLFLYIMEPPVRRFRVKIPTEKLAPRELPARTDLLQRFDEMHAQLMSVVEESDPFDRSKLRVPSPASKRITMTLLDALALLASHARRHLWQAERAVG
jgi:hypothetical protein